MRSTADEPTSLIALIDVRERHSTNNPYIAQLVAAMVGRSTVKWFSWRTALLGKYDIVHFNWPEHVFRYRSKLLTCIGVALGYVWYVRLRVAKTPIVMTMHNRKPHHRLHGAELKLYESFRSLPRHSIFLNRFEVKSEADGVAHHIPHGHYKNWYEWAAKSEAPLRERIVNFGIVKPYKQHDRLIQAFSDAGLDAQLIVAGEAPSRTYEAYVRAKALIDRRITFMNRRLSDAELVELVSTAAIVVLPYRDFYNSGVLLASLSLAAPVLVPRNDVSVELQSEFGCQWVMLYDDPLDSEAIRAAYEAARTRPASLIPDMRGRDWEILAAELFEVYVEASRTLGRRT